MQPRVGEQPVQDRRLVAFGLSNEAETLYRALLRDPDRSVTNLIGLLGLPHVVAQRCVDELVDLSLLRPSMDDPHRLRPVSPAIGLELLLARQEADLRRQQQNLADRRAELATLLEEESAGMFGTWCRQERHTSLDSMTERLEHLARGARNEAVVLEPQPHNATIQRIGDTLFQRLLDNGVTLRTVCLDAPCAEPGAAEYLRGWGRRGVLIRSTPVMLHRMVVLDRSVAFVPSGDWDNPTAAVLHDTASVTALWNLFELVWLSATTIETRRRSGADEIDIRENAVLQLIAEGYTDEQVARKLGVSVRTVRRIAADLMSRLGARSRFQAGVLTTERGWLHRRGPVDRPEAALQQRDMVKP